MGGRGARCVKCGGRACRRVPGGDTDPGLSGKRVRSADAGYAMSKFALVALTHAVRQAGWGRGVRATALCPGFVATGMTAGVTKAPRDAMSKPEDIAAPVGTILRLPDTASVAELLVNRQREDML